MRRLGVIFLVMVLFQTACLGKSGGGRVKFKNVNFMRESYDESIKIILKEIARANGMQIRIDNSVEDEKLTFNFNMPLEGAFKMIVEEYKLSYRLQDGVLIISGGREKRKIIVLKYLDAKRLKEILTKYDIFDSTISIKYGKGRLNNTIYVKGNSEAISELESIIADLEKAEELKQEYARKLAKEKAEIEEKRRQALLEEKRLELLKSEELRKKRELMLEEKIKTQALEEKQILFNNRMVEISRSMDIEIIPLKFINVSKSEIEFQGKRIVVDSLEETLKGLLGGTIIDSNMSREFGLSSRDVAYVKIDKRTNSVIVKDFPERIAKIKGVLQKLDRRPQLVEIEVTIALGNSGFTEELGMRLGGSREYGEERIYSLSTADTISENINTLQSGTAGGEEVELLRPIGALGLSSSMLFMGSKNLLNVQLNMMESDGIGKVLSNPRIVTLNNRGATILSGDSVSIPTATADKMSLQTIETGISIKAKPHIILASGEDIKDGDILLEISIEKSSLGSVSREKIETSKSKIDSNVIMRNGQTLILGGLFQYSRSDTAEGIPLLKDVPLIGLFFKTKNNTLHKNELIFFITPKIITPDDVQSMQSSDYMSYKRNLERQRELLKQRVNRSEHEKRDRPTKFKRKHRDHLKILSGEEDPI